MPLTLPSVFVHIEVKDYIPAAFAGTSLSKNLYFTVATSTKLSHESQLLFLLADFSDALFNPVKTSKPPKTEVELNQQLKSTDAQTPSMFKCP